MKSLRECETKLQLTSKGLLYRLKKFDIIPTKLNDVLYITESQFDKINYPNHNIKEVIYVTQTYWIIESKMNYEI